jgi:tetratricopeptide (TPR) repeat protein
MKRKLIEIAVAFAAIAAIVSVSRGVERLSQRRHRLEVLYLPSGRFVEQASLQYRNLAADILWFRMVQYYGGYRMGENDLALFSHLADVITDLDPQFTFAYVFGALIIAEDLGRFDRGIQFLEKGIAQNGDDWWLHFELGFLHYIYAHDYERALRCFQQAASLPNTDPIAARFAAFVAAKAGHIETSIAMWEELARTSDNPYIRDLAERYIEKLRRGEFRAPGMRDEASISTPEGARTGGGV